MAEDDDDEDCGMLMWTVLLGVAVDDVDVDVPIIDVVLLLLSGCTLISHCFRCSDFQILTSKPLLF